MKLKTELRRSTSGAKLKRVWYKKNQFMKLDVFVTSRVRGAAKRPHELLEAIPLSSTIIPLFTSILIDAGPTSIIRPCI